MNTPRCGHNLSGALSKAVEERQAREDAEKADYAREVKALVELTAAREKKNARKLELSNAIDGRSRQLGRSEAIREPGLQVIITTTTPPPEPLREPPTRVLKLSRASEDLRLNKRRIENLLSRATSTSSDASDEEEP
jgi:hypothetical protein